MALTWEDFSAAPGDKRMIHIVKRGDSKALCGASVNYAIKPTRQCPKCRSLRHEAFMGLPREQPQEEQED